jgi:hypothetical protein
MTHKITIEIETGNDAFQGFQADEGFEVARILREKSHAFENMTANLEDLDGTKVHDINGNPVGKITVVKT